MKQWLIFLLLLGGCQNTPQPVSDGTAPPVAQFDQPQQLQSQGHLQEIHYPSATVGTERRLQVYTPPDYDPQKRYPVLYLLHGIGGDEYEWTHHGHFKAIMDNLYAGNIAEPMIVVLPNGRAQKNDRAEGNLFDHAPAFTVFERDLLTDIIPFIEARYPVKGQAEFRAIAGLSMGGGQALNIGLAHPDQFAWIGSFSSAPNTRPSATLIPDMENINNRLRLLYLSAGNNDQLFHVSETLHRYLERNKIDHHWTAYPEGKHDWHTWKQDLWFFAQQLFQN